MLSALLVVTSVVFLDILLSGDNALVVGMAANTLPEKFRNGAIALGMAGAAIVRIALSLCAVALLRYRIVSILGGLALIWVVYRLANDILEPKEPGGVLPKAQGESVLSVIWIITLADISMSLDNVLAVAAVARDHPFLLVFGLIVSIACVALGAKIASRLLEKYHWLNWVGVGLITLVAIELIGGVHTL